MDFKQKIFTLILFFILAGCGRPPSNEDENIIGNKLRSMTTLSSREGGENKRIAIFDKTVRRIHQFDLSQNTYVKGVSVLQPQLDHYLLYDDSGDYIVDLADGHIAIIESSGHQNVDPLHLPGKPVSAAFRGSLGLLVVLDQLGSIGLLKLDRDGRVEKSWLGGPLFSDGGTLRAGDITDDGKLVISLSDGTVAVVSIESSIEKRAWDFLSMSPGFSQIDWIAPVRGNPDLIMVKNSTHVALMQLSLQAILGAPIEINESMLVKTSKLVDPHIVVSSLDGDKIIYVSDGQLKEKSLYTRRRVLLSSNLNLESDTWSFIDSEGDDSVARRFKHLKFSSLLAVQNQVVPDHTQAELTETRLFTLYKSELGYATSMDIRDNTKHEFKLFNLEHIP